MIKNTNKHHLFKKGHKTLISVPIYFHFLNYYRCPTVYNKNSLSLLLQSSVMKCWCRRNCTTFAVSDADTSVRASNSPLPEIIFVPMQDIPLNNVSGNSRPTVKSRQVAMSPPHNSYTLTSSFWGKCKMQTVDLHVVGTIVFLFLQQWDYCCHLLICMVKTIVCSLCFPLTNYFGKTFTQHLR